MITKLALVALGAYLFSAVCVYLLMEIYSYDCRKKDARFIPSFYEKLAIALCWPYYFVTCG